MRDFVPRISLYRIFGLLIRVFHQILRPFPKSLCLVLVVHGFVCVNSFFSFWKGNSPLRRRRCRRRWWEVSRFDSGRSLPRPLSSPPPFPDPLLSVTRDVFRPPTRTLASPRPHPETPLLLLLVQRLFLCPVLSLPHVIAPSTHWVSSTPLPIVEGQFTIKPRKISYPTLLEKGKSGDLSNSGRTPPILCSPIVHR